MTPKAAPRTNVDFLFSPDLFLRADEAIDLVEHTSVNIVCERPHDLQDFPDIATRLRGALGRALHEMSLGWYDREDAFDRLSPFDFLFGDHGHLMPHLGVPKPYAVRGAIEGQIFRIKILLIGHAQYYAPFVMEAMAQAVTAGIKLTEDGRFHVPMTIGDAWLEARTGIALARGSEARLKFVTPLCVRSGKDVSLSANAFVNSLMLRFGGLLRWSGIALDAVQNATPVPGSVWMDLDAMFPIRWVRHSVRQKGTGIPMQGFLGTLVLNGDLDAVIPSLHLCELFGAGSHAALGLGTYELSVL